MLKNIPPILSPEMLHALRAMGHRHEIAIVDANYPCEKGPAQILRMDGISATDAMDAILTLMPVEENDETAALRMNVDGDPKTEMPIFSEFRELLKKHGEGKLAPLNSISPDEFKNRAKNGYAVVITGERRLYANILLKKGVVKP